MERTELRDRFARWIEETKELAAFLSDLLDHDQRLSERTDSAERETERLRHELSELRKELRDARTLATDARREQSDRLRELEDARQQNAQLRAEKDEAAQALAKVLETVQATNQIAQKLGVTRSPFARREAPTPAAASEAAPQE